MASFQARLPKLLAGLSAFLVGDPTPPSIGNGYIIPPGFVNNTVQALQSGGMTRSFAVNIPLGFDTQTDRQWPLIIDYHGNRGTPFQEYQNSQYYMFPQGQEYLVVYPLGVNGSWQGPSYAIEGVNDIQFTSDLLALLQGAYNIDPDRIYASGKSNGGGFVDTLACSDVGDQFAAFAMAAAALYTDTRESDCPKKRAIIESHGALDTTIPYDGGDGLGGDLPDVADWVQWWGERDCGSEASSDVEESSGYNHTTISCPGMRGVVQHYKVFQLGHCWPSSTGTNFDAVRAMPSDGNCLDKALGFTPVVLDFFAAWNMTNAPKN